MADWLRRCICGPLLLSGEFRTPSAASAAHSASLATAEYVESRVLPIEKSVIEGTTVRQPIKLNRKPLSPGEYDVYLAGPFFNMPELWLVDEARLALRGMGLKVFSPYHDVGIGIGKDVAPKDIEALEGSRACLPLLMAWIPDTFEVGYARLLRNLSLRLCSQHQKSLWK